MFRVILNDPQLLNEEHRHLRRARDATLVAFAVANLARRKPVGELDDGDARLTAARLELPHVHGFGSRAGHGEPKNIHESLLSPHPRVHTIPDQYAHQRGRTHPNGRKH
jgi:hypothetical protein